MAGLLRGLIGYAVLVAATLASWQRPTTCLAVLALLALATLALLRSRRSTVGFCVGAVMGPAAEVIAVLSGVWAYASTDGLIIPLWLPPAWGLATVYMLQISDGLMSLAPSADERDG